MYFRSLSSRRHSKEIARNPKVAGNIVKQHFLGESAVGVYFEGKCRLLKPGEEETKAYECLKKRLELGDDILKEARKKDGQKFYKITVDNFYVFGRFGLTHAKKYQLKWN